MRAIPLLMISALIPATSELGARNDRARILKAYLLASKYVAMLTVALVAFIALEAQSIVRLWIGDGYGHLVLLVQILAIGYGVNILGGAASQTGAGIGRPEFDMRSAILLAILSPLLSLTLIFRFQVPGVAVATALALILGVIYLLWAFHRNYVETSVWSTLRELYARPLIAGVVANLAVFGFHRILPVVQLEDVHFVWMGYDLQRLFIFSRILLDLAAFAPVYIVVLVTLRQVTAMDWNNFVGLVSFGSEFLRHPFRERVKIYR